MPRLLDVVESSNSNRICCQQLFASYSARFSPERCNEGAPSAVEALHFLHFRGTAFAGAHILAFNLDRKHQPQIKLNKCDPVSVARTYALGSRGGSVTATWRARAQGPTQQSWESTCAMERPQPRVRNQPAVHHCVYEWVCFSSSCGWCRFGRCRPTSCTPSAGSATRHRLRKSRRPSSSCRPSLGWSDSGSPERK